MIFLTYVKHQNLAEVIHCLSAPNPPSAKIITQALTNALKEVDSSLAFALWQVVEHLCRLESDNKPDASAIADALATAAHYGKKELIDLLLTMKTENKPNQEAVNRALHTASAYIEWDIVHYLCNLQTDNKPDEEAVSLTLKRAANQRRWDVVINLCSMKTENKPDVLSVDYALDKAGRVGATEAVRVLNSFKVTASYTEKAQVDTTPKELGPEQAKEQQRQTEQQKRQNQLEEEARSTEKPQVGITPKELGLQQAKDQQRQTEQQQRHQHRLEEEAGIQERRKEMQRMHAIAVTLSEIDTVLAELETHIGRADHHHSCEATGVAAQLLVNLRAARNNYRDRLNEPDVNNARASAVFKQECTDLIQGASPVLERDLVLGERLGNALKALINAVIWLGTLGNRSSFFPPTRSTAIIALEQAEEDLGLEARGQAPG